MNQPYPSGPKSRLFGLDIAQKFRDDPLAFAQGIRQYDSDMAYINMMGMHVYFVIHPDLVQEVLVKKASHFVKWDRQKQVFGKFDGNGLVNTDGDFWKRQRKMMQPAFHHNRIRHYADVMVDYTLRHLEQWQSGDEIALQDQLSYITRDIVTKTLFDADVSAETERIGEIIALLQDKTYREFSAPVILPDWLPLAYKQRERQAITELHRMMDRIISERQANFEDTGDLLSMLLLARDEDGKGMSNEQLRDEVTTLFIAGHETTATALTWAMYSIATNPEVEARLMQEIDGLNGETPSFDHLRQLTYTEQVIKEAMRLYPPTWSFPRQVAEPVEIGGYQLSKNSLVQLYPYLTHRDPRWFADPEQFNPDRFSAENETRIPKYAYFPFGGGPRVCIGNSFAMMEMQLILATVLQRYRLSLAPSQGDPIEQPLIVLVPKGGITMRVEAREMIPMR